MTRAARLKAEDGFTLVEFLVAALVLMVGIFAVIASFDAVRRLTTNSESQTVRAQVAEKDLQQIVSLGYANVGLSSAPAHASDPNDPDYYVTNGPPAKFQWDLTNATRTESLCTAATGCSGSIAPGPVAWSAGGESGNIYRFVTWVDDPCDPGTPAACATATDYKRVTVMITQSNVSGPKTPLLLSTVVTDPNA